MSDLETSGKYFREALGHFARDAAYESAVFHLTDLGLSPEEILPRLEYRGVSLNTVKGLWRRRMLETGRLQPETPEEKESTGASAYEFIREYDEFGRPGFRRVPKNVSIQNPADFNGEAR